MKLSITIVNYNQKYFPSLCLGALKESKFKDFEVIVCDNHSSDESIQFLRKAAKKNEIKLIESKKNLGYGAAHNKAAYEAWGQYVLILNTDITVEAETLGKMVEYMEKHSEVGILGPKLMYHNGTVQPSCRRDFKFFDLIIKRTFLKKIGKWKRRYNRYLMIDFDHEKTQEVDLITGAFMMMPKKLFEKVDGFDERFFLFMEDFDLCRKVRGAGYKIVYFPQAVAKHYHKRLSEGGVLRLVFSRISWLHLVSALKYFWKWR
ncbi:MAG: glycosyltransferase family 2 protein [Candidatus Gracilibacteria bacterium]